MKLRTTSVIIVSISLITSQMVWAQFKGPVTNTPVVNDEFQRQTALTTTTTTTTSTTLPQTATIQDWAKESEKKSKTGKLIATGLVAFSAGGVAVTCPKSSKCPYFVAGLVASYMMMRNMSKASGESQHAAQAVTVAPPDFSVENGKTAEPAKIESTVDTRMDGIGNQSPDMVKVEKALAKLKSEGWKIDTKRGDIKSPNGEKLNTKILDSPQAMQQAGMPSSMIKGFTDIPKNAAKKVEQDAKAADAGEGMFGDGTGGGGGATPGLVGSVDGGLGGDGMSAGLNMGVDRDPSQVAGMAKVYNGEKIGVAGDSLFDMIDRRYQLHEKNGSFLAP